MVLGEYPGDLFERLSVVHDGATEGCSSVDVFGSVIGAVFEKKISESDVCLGHRYVKYCGVVKNRPDDTEFNILCSIE